MSTPTGVFDAIVASDPTRPRLTWYDDAEGATRGERIELSGRVLANWVAKAANLLSDELGVERGDVVALDLPVHWRGVYWALAVWRVGATLAVVGEPAAAVVITSRPAAAPRSAGTRVVAVSLPALARGFDGALPADTLDEAADLSGQPDVFVPYDQPADTDAALVGPDGTVSARELGERARSLAGEREWSGGERVGVARAADTRLQDPAGTGLSALLDVLAAWSVDGSVVLVRGGQNVSGAATSSPDPASARWAAERVTSVCDPRGRRASRP